MGAELVIAIISILIGAVISEDQMRSQEKRNAHETYVRSVYQAVQDRYGISMNQLDQMAERLGFNLTQLAESARGSARLSTATSKYLAFLRQYPEKVKQINNVKNQISNQVNTLEAQKNAAAAKIQKREAVDNSEILKDITDSVRQVRQASQENGLIDTSLTEKDVTPTDMPEDPTAQEQKRVSRLPL